MTDDTDKRLSDTKKGHFSGVELTALIDVLDKLRIQVSSILASNRMHPSRPPAGAVGGVSIADTLKGHIAKIAQERKAVPIAPSQPDPQSPQTDPEDLPGDIADTEQSGIEQGSTNQHIDPVLSQTNRKGSAHEPHSNMSEQMQAKTIEHIKKALRKAKQGDNEGADMHAELAENAMKIALEYMSEDEYGIFREAVDTQLRALQGVD